MDREKFVKSSITQPPIVRCCSNLAPGYMCLKPTFRFGCKLN